MRRAIIVTIGCVLLSGCVSLSRSEAVSDVAPGEARGMRIEFVTLKRGELKVTDGFDALFQQRVQAKLDGCATGLRAVRLEAAIERFDKANPVMTAVIGGANVLRGRARLVDVATGAVVGDYRIGRTVVGGRLGVIKMGQAEEQLSDAFGEELCEQAFGAK